jgi:hypothetical protein
LVNLLDAVRDLWPQEWVRARSCGHVFYIACSSHQLLAALF